MRILAYSHDSYGLGHLRRSLNVVREVQRAESTADVLVVTGCARPDLFELPKNADLLALPGLTKDSNGRYVGRRLGLALADLVALRSSVIRSAVESFQPDAMLVDHAAIGLGGELLPTFELLQKKGGTRLILGMRDVLDGPEQARRQLAEPRLRRALERDFHQIVVYGLPHVCDVPLEYGLPREVSRKLRYVGIACNEVTGSAEPGRDRRLLITGGGGEDAGPLFEAGLRFLSSRFGRGWTATLVTGPFMDGEIRTRLETAAEGLAQVDVIRAVPDLARLAATCDAVVSMGGYNTLYENVFARRPLIVHPRTTPRLEQWDRARRLERLGLLVMLEERALNDPRLFARTVDRALQERVDPLDVGLRFDGARLTASSLVGGLSHSYSGLDLYGKGRAA